MPSSELLKLTISEVAPLIQAREVSPVDLAEAALAEAERQQPTLNSFITIMREQALAQAEAGRGSPVPAASTGGRSTASPSASRTTSPPAASEPPWAPKC